MDGRKCRRALIVALQTAHDLASAPRRVRVTNGENALLNLPICLLWARMRTTRMVRKLLAGLPSTKPFIACYSLCRGEYRTAGRAPAGSLPPASQAAQTRVAVPSPTPRAMAWIWPPILPIPCTMMCRLCLRTPVGDVPGLNIEPGDDDLGNRFASWLFDILNRHALLPRPSFRDARSADPESRDSQMCNCTP
jgi:hypothetical protein